ncbi:small-conductance mechanosensitive channel [Methanolinea mesophila]|uniref:mechanosensitive ion channel family protein n=1 Tax=Methanolinea mesophila TaxID=547055 RepID=UPI001AE708FC|nr:mechanosensitive ion channel domain-containing protein [Methanolinea mesophila]MBP1927785.1 small-conductance mechanosensitive channel [Methanolinea mesophila]
MRSYVLPLRYYLLLILIIGVMLGGLVLAELFTTGNMGFRVSFYLENLFTNPVAEKIFETLLVAIFILVAYTIGVYLIVRKIRDEGSRFTAARIFIALLLGLGFLLGMMVWVQDPGQIFLFIGIIWGALLIALRDLIQNVVASLSLLITREFSIGDRIQVKGIYGIVIDIGVFRTTLMQLDEQSGDHPSGKITTVPNGILFRETVTNLTRELSFTADEIRITLPFSSDIHRTRELLLEIVRKHTVEVQQQAREEIESLGNRKYLPEIDTGPTVYVHIDRYQVLMVVKYFTDQGRRAEIKNRIVEEITARVPDITEVNK